MNSRGASTKTFKVLKCTYDSKNFDNPCFSIEKKKKKKETNKKKKKKT